MKKASLGRLLLFYGIFNCFANLVHPITPTMFTNIGFPDYMFGVSFASMSFALFLTSPFWGKVGDKIGHAKVFSISLPMYALAQIGFGLSNTIVMTTIVRFFCGIFGSGALVSSMAYVVNATDNSNRGRYMSYFAAIHSVCAASGYFIGGVVGSKSIFAVFSIQVIALTLAGMLAYFTLKDPDNDLIYTYNKTISPFAFLKDIKHNLSTILMTFLIGVFLTSFATTAYDNALNYYMKEALDLASSYNGIIKAIIGIVGLIVNFSINIYIANKTDSRKSLIYVLALCTLSSLLVPFIKGLTLFFIGNISFFMFNAMYMPIQQALVSEGYDSKESGTISGMFNSVKSAGMIFGSLFAGFIYSWGNKLPFITASIAFLLSVVISYVNYKQNKLVRIKE